MERICKRCLDRGKTWDGDFPKCAFIEGVFSTLNWNCATMNVLRDVAAELDRVIYSEDNWAALLNYDGGFIVLGWYKNRGRTEFAQVLFGEGMNPLTLMLAEEFLGKRHF